MLPPHRARVGPLQGEEPAASGPFLTLPIGEYFRHHVASATTGSATRRRSLFIILPDHVSRGERRWRKVMWLARCVASERNSPGWCNGWSGNCLNGGTAWCISTRPCGCLIRTSAPRRSGPGEGAVNFEHQFHGRPLSRQVLQMTDTPAVAAAGAGATSRTPWVTGHDRGHDPASVSPIGRGYLDAWAGRPLAVCFHKISTHCRRYATNLAPRRRRQNHIICARPHDMQQE
jgi:hypothetical protein